MAESHEGMPLRSPYLAILLPILRKFFAFLLQRVPIHKAELLRLYQADVLASIHTILSRVLVCQQQVPLLWPWVGVFRAERVDY